jgi:hypothetical protein
MSVCPPLHVTKENNDKQSTPFDYKAPRLTEKNASSYMEYAFYNLLLLFASSIVFGYIFFFKHKNIIKDTELPNKNFNKLIRNLYNFDLKYIN